MDKYRGNGAMVDINGVKLLALLTPKGVEKPEVKPAKRCECGQFEPVNEQSITCRNCGGDLF